MVNKRYLPVYIIYSIEREGENVGSGVFCMPFDSFANNVFLAKGNEQQVDFFIHGYTKFKFFGSDVYLTTTHISMIIVIAALLIFAVFANRAIRKATPDQVPGPFLNVVFFPMNLISEFSTPISMSLRLFGNILSGTVMTGLIYGLLPKVLTLIWPAALHIYLDVFSGAIQTYVFCMLTMCFVSDAIGDQA